MSDYTIINLKELDNSAGARRRPRAELVDRLTR